MKPVNDKQINNLLAACGLCELTDAELRALRDRVFGQPMKDDGWEVCKVNWRKPESLQWLREKAEQPL